MSAFEDEKFVDHHPPAQGEKEEYAAQPNENNDDHEDWEIIDQSECNKPGLCTLPCCYTVASLSLGRDKWRYIRSNCSHWQTSEQLTVESTAGTGAEAVAEFHSKQLAVELTAGTGSEVLAELQEMDAHPDIVRLQIRRPLSIRFIRVEEWRLMLKQLKAELVRFPELRSLEIITPVAEGMSEVEEQRKQELDRVDAELQAAVKCET